MKTATYLASDAGVYAIENLKNGRTYIGCPGSISWRWKQHLMALKGGRHSNKTLQKDWGRFGADSFEFRILEYTTTPRLRENVWMAQLGGRARNYTIGKKLCPKRCD